MALTRRGKYSYGTVQADVADEIARYSKKAGYVAEHFANAVCGCGGRTFGLALDDNEGAGVRTCSNCGLYSESEDVRWLYLGCRCPACGLTAVYGDWKNEFNGFQQLLARV